MATPPSVISNRQVHQLSAFERSELAGLWTRWIAENNMVPYHENWHMVNGSGGTQGPGSGEAFMVFHQEMLEDFLAFARENASSGGGMGGNLRNLLAELTDGLPRWDTTRTLPVAFRHVNLRAIGINWELPGWLLTEAEGGGQGQTTSVDGNEIAKLEDITDLDMLGRALGESGVHAIGHVRLGGQMARFDSVAMPAFLLWHGLMVEITEAWYQTPNGERWLEQNPQAPRLNAPDEHKDHHHPMAVDPVAEAERRADVADAASDKLDEAADAADGDLADALDAEAEAMELSSEAFEAEAEALEAEKSGDEDADELREEATEKKAKAQRAFTALLEEQAGEKQPDEKE
jgi:hypothetical protein